MPNESRYVSPWYGRPGALQRGGGGNTQGNTALNDILNSRTAKLDVYVDADNGDDSNVGTSETTAWKTIARAFAELPLGVTGVYVVHLLAGDYALPESVPYTATSSLKIVLLGDTRNTIAGVTSIPTWPGATRAAGKVGLMQATLSLPALTPGASWLSGNITYDDLSPIAFTIDKRSTTSSLAFRANYDIGSFVGSIAVRPFVTSIGLAPGKFVTATRMPEANVSLVFVGIHFTSTVTLVRGQTMMGCVTDAASYFDETAGALDVYAKTYTFFTNARDVFISGVFVAPITVESGRATLAACSLGGPDGNNFAAIIGASVVGSNGVRCDIDGADFETGIASSNRGAYLNAPARCYVGNSYGISAESGCTGLFTVDGNGANVALAGPGRLTGSIAGPAVRLVEGGWATYWLAAAGSMANTANPGQEIVVGSLSPRSFASLTGGVTDSVQLCRAN